MDCHTYLPELRERSIGYCRILKRDKMNNRQRTIVELILKGVLQAFTDRHFPETKAAIKLMKARSTPKPKRQPKQKTIDLDDTDYQIID